MRDDCDDDRGGIRAEGLVLLMDIVEGRVQPTLIPRSLAKTMLDQEIAWLRGETPFQKMMKGLK